MMKYSTPAIIKTVAEVALFSGTIWIIWEWAPTRIPMNIRYAPPMRDDIMQKSF
jgi:hypothetical protein